MLASLTSLACAVAPPTRSAPFAHRRARPGGSHVVAGFLPRNGRDVTVPIARGSACNGRQRPSAFIALQRYIGRREEAAVTRRAGPGWAAMDPLASQRHGMQCRPYLAAKATLPEDLDCGNSDDEELCDGCTFKDGQKRSDGKLDVVEALLLASKLHTATVANDVDKMKILVGKGADINAQTDYNGPPYHSGPLWTVVRRR